MEYLNELNNKIKSILPENTYFTLDDSEQSFVVFPTNYINLTTDFISIQVGKVVYDNVTQYDIILDNIDVLFTLLLEYSDTIEDYASITILADNCLRLYWGGNNVEEDYKDFNNIEDLISYLKINK